MRLGGTRGADEGTVWARSRLTRGKLERVKCIAGGYEVMRLEHFLRGRLGQPSLQFGAVDIEEQLDKIIVVDFAECAP